MQEVIFPLFSNIIKKKYSKSALSLSNMLSRKDITRENLEGRKFKQGITIDDISSRDLDDGIWAYKHDYGYVVEVSIADVAEVVRINTPLDLEAFERSTSVYFNTHALFMLPEDITVGKLSLNNNTTKLTLTVTINLDLEFNVIDSFIEETIFHNKKRFCYTSFNKSFFDVDCYYNDTLSTIHKIAIGLYSNRYKKIIIDDFKDDDRKLLLDLHRDDLVDGKRVIVNDNNELQLIDIEMDLKKIPSFDIQELMILANKEVANFCLKNKLSVPFRNHMPNYIGKISKPKNMARAYYSEKMEGHYALGENSYCHFTSPIRRYADLVLHRQLKYFINPSTKGKKFYSVVDMRKICSYINKKVHSIIDLQITEERRIVIKQNERMLNRLSEDLNSENLKELDFYSFESLITKFLSCKSDFIELPKEVVDLTHLYLTEKKNFSDDLIIRLFFVKSNISLDYLFTHLKTKHPDYISNLFSKYFNRNQFSYSLKHFTSRTYYTGSANNLDDGGSFLKTTKQKNRSRFTKNKPNRFQVKLELNFNNSVIVTQSSASGDERGVESRGYNKFFRKIVNFYRKSEYNPINILLKPWVLLRVFYIFWISFITIDSTSYKFLFFIKNQEALLCHHHQNFSQNFDTSTSSVLLLNVDLILQSSNS